MTVYATIDDLIARYGEDELVELTDRADPPAGTVDATVADKALADASQEIDLYLRVRYALPLDTVPSVIGRVCCQIARYTLHVNGAPEKVGKSYEEAIALLVKIARSTVELGIDAVEPASAPSAAPAVSGPGRVFSRDSLKDF